MSNIVPKHREPSRGVLAGLRLRQIPMQLSYNSPLQFSSSGHHTLSEQTAPAGVKSDRAVQQAAKLTGGEPTRDARGVGAAWSHNFLVRVIAFYCTGN